MKEINWHTGNPVKSGTYLTTRISRFPGSVPYVFINIWRGLDWPGNKKSSWEIESMDGSKTIAWADPEEIEPYKKE